MTGSSRKHSRTLQRVGRLFQEVAAQPLEDAARGFFLLREDMRRRVC
jgi:hypothetical protein